MTFTDNPVTFSIIQCFYLKTEDTYVRPEQAAISSTWDDRSNTSPSLRAAIEDGAGLAFKNLQTKKELASPWDFWCRSMNTRQELVQGLLDMGVPGY